MDKLLENLVQKMVDEGQITIEEPSDSRRRRRARQRQRTQGQVRGHRQVARLPRLQDAEGPAGLARQVQLRPRTIRATWPPASRPAASSKPYEFGDTLNLDVSETLFSAIRREGAKVPLEHGVLGSARPPVRVPELLRHGADARLQPQHDPLRRGPLHAGEEGRAGAGAPDPHAVSRRQPALRAVPRYAPRNWPSASWRACRWARITPTRATA